MKVKSFVFIAGDKRQLYAAKATQSEGYKVYICGFDKLDEDWGIEKCTIKNSAELGDCFVLPMPLTKDGVSLNSPYSEENISIKELAATLASHRVFCSMKNKLTAVEPKWAGGNIYDYSIREEFAVANAVPSAEGAIEVAMREYPGTVHGSRCLVAGFGRIGKVLSKMLDCLGAEVIVAARKRADLALISALGYKALELSELITCPKPDLVFNTAPALIFGAKILAKVCRNSIVIDLASAPGGVDFDSAQRLGVKTIHALSLPGRVAPKCAGEVIKTTIFNMLEEDEQ